MMLSWPAAHFAAGDREVESLLLGSTLLLVHTHTVVSTIITLYITLTLLCTEMAFVDTLLAIDNLKRHTV